MKTYIVGGAVRDALLGLSVKDRDWVVVGATPEQMVAQGFRPVGKDFPVFLHPDTQEEYALARTERKTAPGYRGFVFHTTPDVTLDEDLIRRDLTINAIARADDGSLVDPFGGQRDLAARIFRHVSPAFLEDPVRILRLARFAARYPDFTVAPETLELMRAMVAQGEVDALVAERVWQEVSRALMEEQPSRMLAVLRDCGALARIMPELDALWSVPLPHPAQVDTGVHFMMTSDRAAAAGLPLEVRFAALVQELGMPPIDTLCQRLKVPNDCRQLGVMTAREHGEIARAPTLDAEAIVTLFERCDAFRKPERLVQMLQAVECNVRGRGAELAGGTYAQGEHLRRALAVARAVDAGAVAQRVSQEGSGRERIPQAIHAARVDAVRQGLASAPRQPGES